MAKKVILSIVLSDKINSYENAFSSSLICHCVKLVLVRRRFASSDSEFVESVSAPPTSPSDFIASSDVLGLLIDLPITLSCCC